MKQIEVKHEINKQLRGNPKLLNRVEGYVPTGKMHKASFYKLKGNRLVIEQKDVRETAWRSTSMAHALAKAAG